MGKRTNHSADVVEILLASDLTSLLFTPCIKLLMVELKEPNRCQHWPVPYYTVAWS